MGFVIFVHELIFQLRHIHAAGTFRGTAFAGEAEIKGVEGGLGELVICNL